MFFSTHLPRQSIIVRQERKTGAVFNQENGCLRSLGGMNDGGSDCNKK